MIQTHYLPTHVVLPGNCQISNEFNSSFFFHLQLKPPQDFQSENRNRITETEKKISELIRKFEAEFETRLTSEIRSLQVEVDEKLTKVSETLPGNVFFLIYHDGEPE